MAGRIPLTGGRWDTVDLAWLIIPAAVGLFALRTVMIGRRLKLAASNPALADPRALRDAKASLRTHREHLEAAVAGPKAHLDAAKALGRVPELPAPGTRVDAMVADFLPEKRL